MKSLAAVGLIGFVGALIALAVAGFRQAFYVLVVIIAFVLLFKIGTLRTSRRH